METVKGWDKERGMTRRLIASIVCAIGTASGGFAQSGGDAAIADPPCGRPSEPDPCNEPPSRRTCWACVQCRISSCRSWHPNDAEAQAACREAAMLEYRACLDQVWPPSPATPRTADLDGSGVIDAADFIAGIDGVVGGKMDQTEFFEFIDDFFAGR